MIIVLSDQASNTKFKIESDGELNWCIAEANKGKAGKEPKTEFGRNMYYAQTLDHAVEIVVNKMLLANEGSSDLTKILIVSKQAIKEIAKAVETRVSQIVVEVRDV